MQRAVYLLGAQEPTPQARILAAVLACTPNAVASHTTAAWLWGLVDRPPTIIDVTMLDRRNSGVRAGARIHRRRVPRAGKVRWQQGIPLTAPVDTLLDLAGGMSTEDLEAAYALALSKRVVTEKQLHRGVEVSPPRPGLGKLRELVTAHSSPSLTRSANERLMCRLLRQAELPASECNVVVCGKELDLYWPDAKLAIEVDAFGTHGGPRQFEDDRKVDADLDAADIKVLRFTGAASVASHMPSLLGWPRH